MEPSYKYRFDKTDDLSTSICLTEKSYRDISENRIRPTLLKNQTSSDLLTYRLNATAETNSNSISGNSRYSESMKKNNSKMMHRKPTSQLAKRISDIPQIPSNYPKFLMNNSLSYKNQESQKEIKALVIGATGAGKSSLINLFYVWSQEWKPEDLLNGTKKVLIKTKYFDGDSEAEKNAQNTAESQTIKAKLYTFKLKNKETGISYSLNFLDTPGIGDTDGIEKDEQHLDIIMDTVTKTDGLNTILLVMNGADARINMRIKYIMVRLQSMIPDALRENLMVLLTNVDLCPNLDINKVLDFKINDDKIFYYNNQIFQIDPSKSKNHNIQRKIGQSFQDSINTVSELLNAISSCTVKPTDEFKKIKESRDKLKMKIVDCNDIDAKINIKKQELRILAFDISSGQLQTSDLEKTFNQKVDEENFGTVDTQNHNTICMTCKNCCHEKCGLKETKEQGSTYFKKCTAFLDSGVNCKKCKHSYTSHVHMRVKYTKNTVQVPKIDPNIQLAIQNAKDNNDAQTKAKSAIIAEIKKLDSQQNQNHSEIAQIIQDMKKVCSRFDYIKEIDACINVLNEQIDLIRSDFGVNLDQNDAMKLNALKETKAKMEKLQSDIVLCLKTLKQ